jgi:hypothetical protein
LFAPPHGEPYDPAPPESPADVEEQRRLARLFAQAAPPEPDADAWAEVLARIEAAVPSPAAGPKRSGSVGRLALWLAVGTAAAGIVLALGLQWHRIVAPPRQPEPLPVQAQTDPEEEAFAVAGAGEVTVISMDALDMGALVVGRPPVDGPLVLAAPGDVRVHRMEPHHADGMVPDLHLPANGTPMVVSPLVPPWEGEE